MRAREQAARRRALGREADQIRERSRLPGDAELLALSERGWEQLGCSFEDRARMSAWLRILARDEQLDFALTHARSRAGQEDEHEAKRLYGFPGGQAATHVEQLVGALYDLVPYGQDRGARVKVLSGLWPATLFQEKVWSELETLAAELAGCEDAEGGLDAELLPSWLAEPDEPIDGARGFAPPTEPSLEVRAEVIAKRVALAKPAACESLPVTVFRSERLRAYYATFGVRGLQRLASSSRPAVALALCTDFWRLEPGPSRWRSFRQFLARVEELVNYLAEEKDLREEHFAGGPFSATKEDLSGLVLGATAVERFCLAHDLAYGERSGVLGPPVDEGAIEALGKVWDEVFSGIPALVELVNDHLYPERYGCIVECPLWPLPRRPRLGTRFVEDDVAQLDQATLAKVFCVGCEVLGEEGVDPELLRAWLALWLGALRPRESLVDASDLVPFGRGHLQVIRRHFGKSGRREAYWPTCGLEALDLRPEHFARPVPVRLDPTACAEQACRAVRESWEERRCAHPDGSLPEIPDRLAYFVRKAIADLIRWNAGVPWIVTKVLGHDTETSDTAYTQVSRSELAHLLMDLRARLAALYVAEVLPSP